VSAKEASAGARGEVAAVRRLLNDSVARAAESDGDLFSFHCECDDWSCRETVTLTLAQYRVARFWPVVAHSVVAA
jgi:hypothetical protein